LNLTSLLKRATNGEDIGISHGDKVIALRPVTVHSDDYALQEYGSLKRNVIVSLSRRTTKSRENVKPLRSSVTAAILKRTFGIDLSQRFRTEVGRLAKPRRREIARSIDAVRNSFGSPHLHSGASVSGGCGGTTLNVAPV
jgi:hypothetical protein